MVRNGRTFSLPTKSKMVSSFYYNLHGVDELSRFRSHFILKWDFTDEEDANCPIIIRNVGWEFLLLLLLLLGVILLLVKIFVPLFTQEEFQFAIYIKWINVLIATYKPCSEFPTSLLLYTYIFKGENVVKSWRVWKTPIFLQFFQFFETIN